MIGNHWPARSEGQYESEPYRMLAGETLSYWLQRIDEVLAARSFDPPPAVLVMGDFNDEPFNRSLTEYALGQRNDRLLKSKRAESPYLLNLTWPLLADGLGTFAFGGESNLLDQLLVNRGFFADESIWRVKEHSTEIVRLPEMLDARGGPRRFGRPSVKDSFDPTGFSDHLPVACRIVERD